MSILDKIKSNRPVQEAPRDQVYDAMMGEIRVKAEQAARQVVQSEVDSADARTKAANANALRAEAERDTARQLQIVAETALQHAGEMAASMKKQLILEQQTLMTEHDKYGLQLGDLKAQIQEFQTTVRRLEIDLANAKGKLAAKPKPAPAPPKPLAIPDFKIENVVRGPDNRIATATIKAVRTH